MQNVGRNTNAGFLPASPSADDIFKMIGQKTGGWDELNNSPAGQALKKEGSNPADDLAECFAKVYATPAGERMIDAILDQTLRRSPYLHSDKGATLEQQTAYGLERKGQNGIAIWILSEILKGQSVKKPAGKRKRK